MVVLFDEGNVLVMADSVAFAKSKIAALVEMGVVFDERDVLVVADSVAVAKSEIAALVDESVFPL